MKKSKSCKDGIIGFLQFAKFKIDALNMRNQLNYSIFKEQL